jgi:hypothetical protein
MYPNYGPNNVGANCVFRILEQAKHDNENSVPLEAVIVSAGIQNQVAQPNKLAIQNFIDHFSHETKL